MPRAAPLPADERRAAIIAATEPLLVARGSDVSTREIATAASIAEGTIFRVFDSKEALIDAVMQEAMDVSDTCRQLREIDADADLELRLVQAVALLQARLARVFALFQPMARSRGHGPDPDAHERHRRDNERLDSALSQVIAPDADALRLSPPDAARLLKTLTFAVSHPLLSDQRHCDPKQIVDILLHGIINPDSRQASSC